MTDNANPYFFFGGLRKLKRRRVLSLDGGGIYGLTQALLLKQLCERDKKFLRDGNIFLFAGCSAGAINSLIMAKYQEPRQAVMSGELEQFWEDAQAFRNDDPVGSVLSYMGLSSWYGEKSFIELLERYFADFTLEKLPNNVLISTYAWTGGVEPEMLEILNREQRNRLDTSTMRSVHPRVVDGMEDLQNRAKTWFPWLAPILRAVPTATTGEMFRLQSGNKKTSYKSNPHWMRYDDADPLIGEEFASRRTFRTDTYRHWQPKMFTNLGAHAVEEMRNNYRDLAETFLKRAGHSGSDMDKQIDALLSTVSDALSEIFESVGEGARVADIAYAAAAPPGFRALRYGLGDGASFSANPAPHAYVRLRQFLSQMADPKVSSMFRNFSEVAGRQVRLEEEFGSAASKPAEVSEPAAGSGADELAEEVAAAAAVAEVAGGGSGPVTTQPIPPDVLAKLPPSLKSAVESAVRNAAQMATRPPSDDQKNAEQATLERVEIYPTADGRLVSYPEVQPSLKRALIDNALAESISVLSIGDGTRMPYYWMADANLGFGTWGIGPTNPVTGVKDPPTSYALQASNEESDALMREIMSSRYMRLNPGVMDIPTVTAAMYARFEPFRKWIIRKIRAQIDRPDVQRAVGITSEWMSDGTPFWCKSELDVPVPWDDLPVPNDVSDIDEKTAQYLEELKTCYLQRDETLRDFATNTEHTVQVPQAVIGQLPEFTAHPEEDDVEAFWKRLEEGRVIT